MMVRRNDSTVKLDAEVARVARIVAAYRGLSLAEYLSETLRPVVTGHLADHARATGTPAKAKPGPKPKGKP